MKHLQKLVTIVLAFVLALSLSLTALAEEDYGQEVTGEGNLFQNNEAQTTFSVVAVPANLSATVPLNVTFAVKRNGNKLLQMFHRTALSHQSSRRIFTKSLYINPKLYAIHFNKIFVRAFNFLRKT